MTQLERDKLNIITLPNKGLNIDALIHNLWGDARADELRPLLRRRAHDIDCHILGVFNHLTVAHAKVFHRDILASGVTVKALALSAVFVLPIYRRQGYGREIVKAAFGYVDKRDFQCCLFQTWIPGFYEWLGARRVYNKFEGDPWSDPHVMVYPAAFQLDGEIDIQGAGW